MKIQIEQIPVHKEEELLIRCYDPLSPWVTGITAAASPEQNVIGWQDGTAYRLPLQDICYFEVVDGKSFLYAEKAVYESRLKLYEFEETSKRKGFFRSGKSMVLNADKIISVVPSFSGRFTASLTNGEKVVVSRQYVSELKKQMGL